MNEKNETELVPRAQMDEELAECESWRDLTRSLHQRQVDIHMRQARLELAAAELKVEEAQLTLDAAGHGIKYFWIDEAARRAESALESLLRSRAATTAAVTGSVVEGEENPFVDLDDSPFTGFDDAPDVDFSESPFVDDELFELVYISDESTTEASSAPAADADNQSTDTVQIGD